MDTMVKMVKPSMSRLSVVFMALLLGLGIFVGMQHATEVFPENNWMGNEVVSVSKAKAVRALLPKKLRGT